MKTFVRLAMLLSAILAFHPSACGQQSTLRVPLLGFVYDETGHSLRPVQGIPGASVLGDPLDLGVEVAAAVVSPKQDYALVLTAQPGDVWLTLFESDSISVRSIDALSQADHIDLSPVGTAAVLYRSVDSRFQVVRGLPGSPVTSAPIDLSNLGVAPGPLAVSDDGELILAVATDGADSLTLLHSQASLRVPIPGHVAAIAFRPGTHDALAVNRDGQVWFISDLAANSDYRLIATLDSEIRGASVAFLRDGSRAIVANAATGKIALVDPAGGAPLVTSCDCRPATLQPFKGRGLFRLNEVSDKPMLLFDASEPTPRILFVPPSQPAPDRRAQ